jgi:predicted CoA-binding protein
MPLTQDQDIKTLLENAKTIAVVGYSNKPGRPSRDVFQALKDANYQVYPVNPTLEADGDLKVYPNLKSLPVKVDIVDIFRRAEDVPPVVEEAIEVGAKAVWMQLGIVNEEAARRAESAGLQVVMDHCMKIERRRLFG